MSQSHQGPTLHVLLIEGDRGAERRIRDALREAGPGAFDLHVVESVEGARAWLAGSRADVVLLDLRLPESEGLEALERAQRIAEDQPIVVLSGPEAEGVALKAVRAGAQDYLVKGHVDAALLTRVLRSAVVRKEYERERVEAEKWIRRLSMAVDQGPASVIITDLSGRIEYVNARFTEITGYTAEEALGGPPGLLKSGLTPSEVYEDLWTTILSGEVWEGEIQNRRKDGSLYWDSVRISPIVDAEGRTTHFLALQEDITGRRELVEALRERNDQFRQVTESIAEIYILADADLGRIHYVSPAYATIWGRSVESLYAAPRSFLEVVLPEDLAGVIEHVNRVRVGGRPESHEYRIRRPDGELRWIRAMTAPVLDDEGEVYRIAGVGLDITERREAEEGLRSSERRLRTLLETVKLVVLALDHTGKVDYVNPYLLELTGYAVDEVLGNNWLEQFISDDARPRMWQVFEDLLEHGHSHHQNPIATRTGETRVIAWHNTVLRDPDGRATGTLSVGEDITDKIRLEEQLRQSQKMEAIGQLAGGVAHDFNNLLTVIIGPAELVLETLDLDDPIAADLREIKAAAERAAGLTRQLLAFSRQQPLEPRIVDLNALIGDLSRMLRRVIGEDVALSVETAEGLASVRADPGQLEQVILNLAVNARDAMAGGGRLTIETANITLDHTHAESADQMDPGRYVMLAVSDTGIGMDQPTMERIFEPFYTTKKQGQGTGLGLATVYGIVEQSGGRILPYSEPGAGTTLKIYLPSVDAAADPLAPPPSPESLRGTETVLVVEDAAAVRQVTRRILEAHGYRVLEAASGQEGLEIARRHDGPIPLLVTDVVMPEISGRELAEQLTSIHPAIRVIFVSGYPDRTILAHGVVAPDVHYIQKPFTSESIARKVREVLDHG